MRHHDFDNDRAAALVLESPQSTPDEATAAALYLHSSAEADGTYEQLILNTLEPLIERESSFVGGRPAFLAAVRLVAELACRRQRWRIAHNSLLLLSALGPDQPRWVKNYRAKVYFRLRPKTALGKPSSVVHLLEPLDSLDSQGTAVLHEYVALARSIFFLEGDDGTRYVSFLQELRGLVGASLDPASLTAPKPGRIEAGGPAAEAEPSAEALAVVEDEAKEAASDLIDRPADNATQVDRLLKELDVARRRIEELEAGPPVSSGIVDTAYELAEVSINAILGRRHILVLGALQANERHLVGIAKSRGLEKHHLQFESDYAKLTNFDLSKLQYSMNCAGVLLGPVPHNMKCVGDTSSPLQLLTGTEGYPPTVAMRSTAGELKGSKEAFSVALSDLLTQFVASTPTSAFAGSGARS